MVTVVGELTSALVDQRVRAESRGI